MTLAPNNTTNNYVAPSRLTPTSHQRGLDKLARLPILVESPNLRKKLPPWLRTSIPSGIKVNNVKRLLRNQGLTTVCEEATCPNLGECFNHGTATFMLMGDICTRRCPFCDVAHGHPAPLDSNEPLKLAQTVLALNLRYVVITSVNRDDLRDGGAAHFAACVKELRTQAPNTQLEILVPDFRKRSNIAVQILAAMPPDIFNHNLETVPRLYPTVRPGADYAGSLKLLSDFAQACPQVPIKSGLMLGLGETISEVEAVLQDLLDNGCSMLTMGQYLQPTTAHLPVTRFIPPQEFAALGARARALGFTQVASAPLVRSSYHAEQQARDFFHR